jgi:hypothetical protein
MNTQTHKWLPSEPTPAMLEAEQFASSLAYESHEVQAVEVYKSMWQAAPTLEPLSEDEIMRIVNAHEGDTIGVVRAIEKAHGIGETKCI